MPHSTQFDPFRLPDVPPISPVLAVPDPIWSVGEARSFPSNWIAARDGSLINLAHVRKVTLHKVTDEVHEIVALDALPRETTGPAVVLYRGSFFEAGKALAMLADTLSAIDPAAHEALPDADGF